MKFQGKGFKFPFTRTDAGSLAIVEGDEKLIQNVAEICNTELGSVYYQPQKGWAKSTLLFIPITEVLTSLIETLLGDAIRDQEPRVNVEGFLFEKKSVKELTVSVFFSSKETNESLSFVFPFYRQENASN